MLHKIYYAYLLQVNIKEGESKHQQDDLEGEKVSEVFVVCHFFFLIRCTTALIGLLLTIAISVQYYAV